MDPYSSHLPVLQAICESSLPSIALECGMGLYSTPYLMSNCDSLISIESDSQDWYDVIRTLYGGFEYDWIPVMCRGESEHQVLLGHAHRRYDLIFVDGAASSRALSAAIAMSMADTVVCHDADAGHYDDIVMYPGYSRYVYTLQTPHTLVFTNNQDILTTLGGLSCKS